MENTKFTVIFALLGSPLLLATMMACNSGGSSGVVTEDPCRVMNLNQWVDSRMRDYYIYADQMPMPDVSTYDSPESLIRDLRVAPDVFSYVDNAREFDEASQEGKEFGLGYLWLWDRNGQARIADVQRLSPFGVAGVQRSDIIVSVNGIDWNDLSYADYVAFVGDRDSPKLATWQFIKGDTGEIVVLDITQALYDITTAPYIGVFTSPSGTKVGYLVINRFASYTLDEINTAFDYFQDQAITELVLDLRYNGGGLTSVARRLASKIGGAATAGQLMYTRHFNDKYSSDNQAYYFSEEPNALNLKRVLVLSTSRTASASEIVINSLRPYVDVITLGSRTRGKPFTSIPDYQCDRVMFAMSSIRENSRGVSVAGGIAPVCVAVDRLERDYGLNDGVVENMLSAALSYLEESVCDVPIFASLRRRGEPADEMNRQGVRPVPGAYE